MLYFYKVWKNVYLLLYFGLWTVKVAVVNGLSVTLLSQVYRMCEAKQFIHRLLSSLHE